MLEVFREVLEYCFLVFIVFFEIYLIQVCYSG
jgi:hypothetical protein